MSAVLHDIRVFFDHLADVGWTALGIALLCQLAKLCCTSRAWRNILATSYAEESVRWRSIFGAYLARVGVIADTAPYLRHVAVWQVADWSLRLVAIFFFLRAFHVPATLHNAILVQVTQSLAVLFPISPSGIGTEQALLLYTFAGKAAKSVLLSFSVGMRVTLIIFNALLGFGAILLMMRTLHWRQHVEADRDAVAEQSR